MLVRRSRVETLGWASSLSYWSLLFRVVLIVGVRGLLLVSKKMIFSPSSLLDPDVLTRVEMFPLGTRCFMKVIRNVLFRLSLVWKLSLEDRVSNRVVLTEPATLLWSRTLKAPSYLESPPETLQHVGLHPVPLTVASECLQKCMTGLRIGPSKESYVELRLSIMGCSLRS